MEKIKNSLNSLLDRTGRYFKIDAPYLVKGGFWVTASQVASSAAAFVLSILYANFLLPETYGMYKYVISLMALFTIPSLSGMSSAVNQAIARGSEGSLMPGLKVRIKWGMFGALAAAGTAVYYLSAGNSDLGISLIIIACFVPFIDSFSMYDALLLGRKKFDTSSIYFLVNQLIAVAVSAAAVYFTRNLFAILIAYVATWTVLRAITFYRVVTINKPNNAFDPLTIKFGKDLSFIGAIGIIADYFDMIVVFHYVGVVSLAVYTIATAPVEQVKSLLTRNITKLALPKYAEKDVIDLKRHALVWTGRLFILLFVPVIAYILAAPYLFGIVFPSYPQSVLYTQIFALSILSIVMHLPLTALNAHIARKQLYYFKIVSSIVEIGLLFFFVNSMGLIGVVLARIIAGLLNTILSILLLRSL